MVQKRESGDETSTIRDVNKIVSPLIGSVAVQTSSWFVIMSEFFNFFFRQNSDFSGFVKILCRQNYSLYGNNKSIHAIIIYIPILLLFMYTSHN